MGRYLLRRQIVKLLKKAVFSTFAFFICNLAPLWSIPLTQDSAQKKIRRLPLDLPVPLTSLVETFKADFLTPSGKTRLRQAMEDAVPYRSFIRYKLDEYGLPRLLEFLPVIESDFQPYAVSKSGATGIWQFMTNSIAPFNIRANEWLDERRDPWLSTDAALRKLRDNYNRYNDWYLALAAYNWGTGSMDSAIKKAGGMADYWYLCQLEGVIRKETRDYVPKLLAVADLLSNSEYYGIEIPPYDADAHTKFALIETKFAVDINLLAEKIGCDPNLLTFYNPGLNTFLTPPDQPYQLRVPAEYEAAAIKVIAENPLLPLSKDFSQK